jgi:hypothetical protein
MDVDQRWGGVYGAGNCDLADDKVRAPAGGCAAIRCEACGRVAAAFFTSFLCSFTAIDACVGGFKQPANRAGHGLRLRASPCHPLPSLQLWPFASAGRGIDGHDLLRPEQYQYSMEYWISKVRGEKEGNA